MSEKNKELVQQVNDAFSNNKPEIFMDLCSDDIHWSIAGDQSFNGKDAIRKFMASMGDMEPPKFSVDRIIADGDSVACYGDMSMKGKSGKDENYTFCDIYRFNDGKIVDLQSIMAKHKTEDESNAKAV